MAFGSKMDDSSRLLLSSNSVHELAVPDIAMNELVSCDAGMRCLGCAGFRRRSAYPG